MGKGYILNKCSLNVAHLFQDIVGIENTTKEKIKPSSLYYLAVLGTVDVPAGITNLAKRLCPESPASWVSYVIGRITQPLETSEQSL